MDRYDPYFAAETDGVHFQVEVDGNLVQAYVSRTNLSLAYGPCEPGAQSLAAYLTHRAEIDAVVQRRVRVFGPETVLVRRAEIGAQPTACLAQSVEPPRARVG